MLQSFSNAPDVSDATELRLSLLACAASMSLLDQSEAPQMAVVPEFRDNYHLEDPDHHRQRGALFRGFGRCVAAGARTCAALPRTRSAVAHGPCTGPPSHAHADRRRWPSRVGQHGRAHLRRRAACRSPQGRCAAPLLAPLAGTISQGARMQSSCAGSPRLSGVARGGQRLAEP